MKIALPARPPFSLNAVVYSHGWARLAPFQVQDGESDLVYIYRTKNGQVVKLIIQETADGVQIDSTSELDGDQADEIASSVAWMLALDEDFSDFYALAREEPKLSQVERKSQGRLLRSPTLFEDTIKTILTTNTSWTGTVRMVDTLVKQFGEPLPGTLDEYAFPTPEGIARSDEQTLRDQTRLGYRAPYVLDLAQQITSGSLDLEGLKSIQLPTEGMYKELLSIKGVGGYAAANLMMLLGNYEYLTIDSWAIKMVSNEFFGGEEVSHQDVEAIFEPWGKWKGLAYWLWDWSDFS